MKWVYLTPLLTGLLWPMTSDATEVYVVEAKGVDLTQGQALDGSKPLNLTVGQRVTLITSDGRTIKLKGPFSEPPAPDQEGANPDVVNSLKGLLKSREANTSSAGAIRQGTISFEQPDPWVVEIMHNGDRCLRSGEQIVFWRDSVETPSGTIEISPIDKSWSAHAIWPGKSDKLALPTSLSLQDGQVYTISLSEGSSTIKIHVIPTNIRSQPAQAAWMLEVGCDPQAKSLIGKLD